jgi:hypothetical protein
MLNRVHNFTPFIQTFEEHRSGENEVRRAAELARDALILARDTLMLNLRFMEAALTKLELIADETVADYMTDGLLLIFRPAHVIDSWRQSSESLARDILHIVLHCLFRHPFAENVKFDAWDFACDVAVEGVIASLNLPAVYSPRAARQSELLAYYSAAVEPLTADRLYRVLTVEGDWQNSRWMFYADDHAGWYDIEPFGGKSNLSASGGEERIGSPGSAPGDAPEAGNGGDVSGGGFGDEGDSYGIPAAGCWCAINDAEAREEAARQWSEIAESARVRMETSPNLWGTGDGHLIQTIVELTRERFDYAGFLSRFCSWGEALEVSDEEFDYILYTYGLSNYGDMPIIEPLEYCEAKRVREFVIAIDTSESVAGDLVRTFVVKSFNILKQRENFFTRINIHMLQSSTDVLDDQKITSAEELDGYFSSMTLHGFGGTDFRPVFKHVDDLIAAGEFENLKGLIYFTDGYGDFPVSAPSYEVAFVFCTESEPPAVPVWATRIILPPGDIE